MRVSTSQIFNAGTLGIQQNQSDLYTLQNQMSTGRRILTPADDPIGASQALLTTQSQGVNKQFLDNQAAASTQLNLVSSKLGSVGDELQNIYEKAVQAGNGSYGAGDRGAIATELKQRLTNLVSLANSKDASGLYVFSGFQTNVQPFQITGSGGNYQTSSPANPLATYQGDAGVQSLQVSSSQTMAITENGSDLFLKVRDSQGNLTGRSMFDSIQNMIDILDPSSGIPFSQASYNKSLGDIQASIDHVSTTQASVGARMQSLDSLTAVGQDVSVLYDQQLSNLQDLDYTKAISDLSKKTMQLQAAQQTFKQTSQLSLFSIL